MLKIPKYSCGSDDITFCVEDKCKNRKCFRHICNMIDPTISHSFSMFKNTIHCPSYVTDVIDDSLKEIRI